MHAHRLFKPSAGELGGQLLAQFELPSASCCIRPVDGQRPLVSRSTTELGIVLLASGAQHVLGGEFDVGHCRDGAHHGIRGEDRKPRG